MKRLAAAPLFLLLIATPAQAHHPIVQGAGICNQQTGLYDVTWTVANSENVASPGDRDMTITASNRASVPVGTVIQEASAQTFSEPSLPAGTQTLTVTGRWEYDINGSAAGGNTVVVQSGSTTINLEGECVSPSPSPSPSPSIEPSPSPSAPVIVAPPPSPTLEPSPEPSPNPSSQETPAAPGASPVSANDDIDDVSANEDISESPGADSTNDIIEPSASGGTPSTEIGTTQLPRTGVDPLLGLALGLDLVFAGLLFRRRANRA